jgi:hypothetical protein
VGSPFVASIASQSSCSCASTRKQQLPSSGVPGVTQLMNGSSSRGYCRISVFLPSLVNEIPSNRRICVATSVSFSVSQILLREYQTYSLTLLNPVNKGLEWPCSKVSLIVLKPSLFISSSRRVEQFLTKPEPPILRAVLPRTGPLVQFDQRTKTTTSRIASMNSPPTSPTKIRPGSRDTGFPKPFCGSKEILGKMAMGSLKVY